MARVGFLERGRLVAGSRSRSGELFLDRRCKTDIGLIRDDQGRPLGGTRILAFWNLAGSILIKDIKRALVLAVHVHEMLTWGRALSNRESWLSRRRGGNAG
jgi:hypothetical protein